MHANCKENKKEKYNFGIKITRKKRAGTAMLSEETRVAD